jgi:tol-pal system protein YbgF
VSPRVGAVILAVSLTGCAEVAKQPSDVDSSRTAPATANQPGAAADPIRLNEQVARIASELTELQNAVAKLIAASRQQDDQLTYLRRRVEELESPNRGRLPAAPSGFAPSAPAAPGPPAAPPLLGSATTVPAADLYRSGVEQLRAKATDAAILTFYDLIATYPESPLRESAQYLVADLFYKQKDWRGALAEFEALIAAVPRGEKAPDALLKIGLCQKELGDATRARRTWERVVREHPASAAARQARVLLRS